MNTPLKLVDRSPRQEINKVILALTHYTIPGGLSRYIQNSPPKNSRIHFSQVNMEHVRSQNKSQYI